MPEFVPEADAQEQAEPVEPDVEEPDRPDTGLEVPEADALEQAMPAPVVEEDY
ncbi:MAG TPA: hypothetical protein VFA94_14570 [Acidimicrobiales bacterium]|nr:hypothetical protein [Acidimicrobiales bacterium]